MLTAEMNYFFFNLMIFSFLFPLHPLTTSPDTEEGRTLTFFFDPFVSVWNRDIDVLVFGLGAAFLGHFWLPVHSVSTLVPIYDMKLEAFPCRGHTNIYIK